jgi:subtilase family serine protease
MFKSRWLIPVSLFALLLTFVYSCECEEQCPDLIVQSIDLNTLEVDCFGNVGAIQCTTTVTFSVANTGTVESAPFDVRIVMDPSQNVVVNHNVSGGLAAGATKIITVTSPPGGNCYDPDCTITIIVDPADAIFECDETNNELNGTVIG